MTDRDLTLAGLKAAYAKGLTPAQLAAELRSASEAAASHNVFIHVLSEAEQTPWLQALDDMDPETTPLWGVPFVLKDNMDLAGIPTTAACEAFTYTPDTTAHVVQRLIDAGAFPVGKANLDQFATGLNGTRSTWGPCRNSFNPDLVSGGSSSGSAVSVALGLASFSLGTDTAGSGRVPACFNNLVGVKPTRGLLSATGVVPACRSLDCVSIFALHSEDANHVLSVAEGLDADDPYSRNNTVINHTRHYGRFAEPLALGFIPEDQLKFFGDTEYEACYQAAIETLKTKGVTLKSIDYALFDEVARLLYEGPWVSERYIATLPLIRDQPEAVFPAVRGIIEAGETPKATDLFKAQYRLQTLKARCEQYLEGVDALLTPTAGRHFTIEEMLEEPVRRNSELGYYTNFVNLLDMAAIAVPIAMTQSATPFGITLTAEAFSDRRLLSIANCLQQWFPMPLGAGSLPQPAMSDTPVSRNDWQDIVVCGAHMKGMPLNWQLSERGARFITATTTTPDYRLYALDESPIKRPALVRSAEGGQAIEVEVWRMPASEYGSFLSGIAAPLGLGQVALQDHTSRCGFIAEGVAVESATEVTQFGGWRSYMQSL